MSMLSFEVADAGRYRIVTVHGDVDLSNAKELSAVLEDAAAAGPVVVDLAPCTYLDSTGLSIFVRHERAHRGNLVLVAPSGHRSLRLFEITGLALTLALVRSREEAAKSFSERQLTA